MIYLPPKISKDKTPNLYIYSFIVCLFLFFFSGRIEVQNLNLLIGNANSHFFDRLWTNAYLVYIYSTVIAANRSAIAIYFCRLKKCLVWFLVVFGDNLFGFDVFESPHGVDLNGAATARGFFIPKQQKRQRQRHKKNQQSSTKQWSRQPHTIVRFSYFSSFVRLFRTFW